MKDLDLHPADDSLLGRVLRMSFQLWYYKAILKKYPRTLPLRGITESLVQRRMRLLRRLRALNMTGYKKAIEVLQISDVKHTGSFNLPTDTEQEKRKENVKEECYQRRLSKLAQLKRALAIKKEEFYSQKATELNRLVDLLAQLDCSADATLATTSQDNSSEVKSEAVAKLKRLLELVVAERRVDTLAPTRAGALWWYSKEAVLREHVNNSIAEREAQHLRQRRRK
uniref:Uncharacterized protein n=2 Tax=Schistocephalus solidus TaxID=70667 RepID=A0A0X3PZ76_SCHSO